MLSDTEPSLRVAKSLFKFTFKITDFRPLEFNGRSSGHNRLRFEIGDSVVPENASGTTDSWTGCLDSSNNGKVDAEIQWVKE